MSVGRPTKYEDKYAKIAEKMAEVGATEAEIAECLEINTTTLWRWKQANKQFCNALKVGKEKSDDRVENALYHRALGYSHKEDDIRALDGQIVITQTVKHYPPDTTACIFWLKNRRPEQYRANPDESPQPQPISITIENPKP